MWWDSRVKLRQLLWDRVLCLMDFFCPSVLSHAPLWLWKFCWGPQGLYISVHLHLFLEWCFFNLPSASFVLLSFLPSFTHAPLYPFQQFFALSCFICFFSVLWSFLFSFSFLFSVFFMCSYFLVFFLVLLPFFCSLFFFFDLFIDLFLSLFPLHSFLLSINFLLSYFFHLSCTYWTVSFLIIFAFYFTLLFYFAHSCGLFFFGSFFFFALIVFLLLFPFSLCPFIYFLFIYLWFRF